MNKQTNLKNKSTNLPKQKKTIKHSNTDTNKKNNLIPEKYKNYCYVSFSNLPWGHGQNGEIWSSDI